MRGTSLRKKAGSATLLLFALAIIPGIFAYGSWNERQRRVHVLQEGKEILAKVIKSDDDGYKNLCKVEFVFEWNSLNYSGDIVDCDTMKRFPKGSLIPVRFDPNDPSNPLAAEETSWPPYAIVPVLVALPWLLLALLFGFSLSREALAIFKRRLTR